MQNASQDLPSTLLGRLVTIDMTTEYTKRDRLLVFILIAVEGILEDVSWRQLTGEHL